MQDQQSKKSVPRQLQLQPKIKCILSLTFKNIFRNVKQFVSYPWSKTHVHICLIMNTNALNIIHSAASVWKKEKKLQ